MDDLLTALRSGQQCDDDGVMCLVSRQACHEAADEIERLRSIERRVVAVDNFLMSGEADEMADDEVLCDVLGHLYPDRDLHPSAETAKR